MKGSLIDRNRKGILMEDAKSRAKITREQLMELEQKEKTPAQLARDMLVTLLPLIAFIASQLEYWLVPNKYRNANPERYTILLLIPIAIYMIRWVISRVRYRGGDKKLYWRILHMAPLWTAVYVFLTAFDWLTLKTGKLMYPFIPWVNDILNAAITDWRMLLKSTLFSLRLLLLGYFWGVAVGLVTGIACGYSEKIRYWINPIVKLLGPIPVATWLPLIMLLFPSPFSGSIFIIALGTWFAVTMATITGISNIDRSYFDAARILGAKGSQLIFRVAIPHAVPNILQGMTQGMSSACIGLMVAEMMGVEAGLGWYITWAKAWAMFNRMFAAIVVICIIFNAVAKALELIKRRALRWQNGGSK